MSASARALSEEPRGFWFRKKPVYDRREILAAAAAAEGKGRRKKAIAEYKRVLEMEPENATVLGKVGVLLAETKQRDEAWRYLSRAAQHYRQSGFVEKASAIYAQATHYFPKNPDAWLALAEMRAERNLHADGAAVLLQGSKQLRGRKLRPEALRLLRRAFEMCPWSYDPTVAFARALAKNGERNEALLLLEDFAERLEREGSHARRRKVRGIAFRMSPTPGAAWLWLRAAVGK